MPKHVIALTLTVGAFFTLVWFGVAVLGQSADRTLLVSTLTIFLIGIGVVYSLSTLREDKSKNE